MEVRIKNSARHEHAHPLIFEEESSRFRHIIDTSFQLRCVNIKSHWGYKGALIMHTREARIKKFSRPDNKNGDL